MKFSSLGGERDLLVDLVVFECFCKKFKIMLIRGTIRTEENPSAKPDPTTRSLVRVKG